MSGSDRDPRRLSPNGAAEASPSGQLFGLLGPPILATVIVTAVVVVFEIAGISRFHAGELTDADAYMRLERVVQLAGEGRWYDPSWTRTNAPYGETMHYTRPLDAVLLAGAWAGSAVLDFRSALVIFGGLLGPLLLVALVLVLRWGFEPRFRNLGPFAVLVLVTCLQPTLLSAFHLGRPDHHSLIALVFAAQFACLARLAGGRSPGVLGLVLGVLGGLGIWVSVELLLAQALAAISLVYLWLSAPDDDPRPGLTAIRNYTLGIFVALVAGLGLERPPSDWLTPAVARISIVHVWIAALAALTWLVIDLLARRRMIMASPLHRFGLTVLGGVVPIIGTLLLHPKFFLGPWADFGPVVRAWLKNNAELRSLVPTNVETAARFVFQLGSMLVALLFVAWHAPRASARERRMFAIILFGLVVYLPLSLMQERWARYPQLLVVLPWAMCLLATWRWRGGIAIGGRHIPLRTLPFLALLYGHFGLAVALAGSTDATVSHRSACDWPAIATFLDRNQAGGPGDDILFSYVFEGSQLMWRTPYDVVGTPHGNEQALIDTHRIFDAPTDRDARDVIAARGIDLILICIDSAEGRTLHDRRADQTVLADLERGRPPDYRFLSDEEEPQSDQTTFHTRLKRGLLPSWIEPVELPPELAAFRLFRVDYDSAERPR